MGERKKARVVEVEPSGVTWCKSSASASGTDQCVEAAWLSELVLVRSSRDRPGPKLALRCSEWTGLLATIRTGAFDLVR